MAIEITRQALNGLQPKLKHFSRQGSSFCFFIKRLDCEQALKQFSIFIIPQIRFFAKEKRLTRASRQ
jgi:hypothetical protein